MPDVKEEEPSFKDMLRESETHVAYWAEMIENCSPEQLAETIADTIRRHSLEKRAAVAESVDAPEKALEEKEADVNAGNPTGQESRDMDSTKLRIRVAELCGWEQIEESQMTKAVYFGRMNGWDYKAIVPDYCTDLNAMHEAEELFTQDIYPDYVYRLVEINGDSHPIRATARQRAEAFVATMEASSVPKA